MLAVTDPYKVLQVDPDADPEVIRAAYRRLAQKHHPDYGGSDERMAQLNAAYSVLRDPARRAGYDAARRRFVRDEPSSPGRPVPSARTAEHRSASGDPTHPNDGGAAGPLARARAYQASQAVPGDGGQASSPGERMLDFGRYAGWTIAQIAGSDPDFLEWLERMPVGRQYRPDIEAALTRVGRRPSPDAASERPRPTRPGAFQRASQAVAVGAFGRPRRFAFLRR